MTWKYGLMLVSKEGAEEVSELVELYADEDGNYTSYCRARINSIEELQAATRDIERNGVYTWFYDNGEFSWDQDDRFWRWEPKL